MYMNARGLKKIIHVQDNQYISNLSKFQELLYSEVGISCYNVRNWNLAQ